MTETLNFTYESIGNFAKLLTTIQYEKSHNSLDIAVWHEMFDKESADELFESFLVELFPEGKTIDVEDIELIMNRAIRFLDTDEESRKVKASYLKRHFGSYVYFKPDIKVIRADFGQHQEIIRDICFDYFKDADNLTEDQVKKFILNNFEIGSNMSSLESIANDCRYIANYVSVESIIKRAQ